MAGLTTRGATSCDQVGFFFALWVTKGNYSSLLLYTGTTHFRSYHHGRERERIEHERIWLPERLNKTKQIPKLFVGGCQKPPGRRTRTNTHMRARTNQPSFLRVWFYIARKQPLSNIPPIFITSLRCPICLCQVTAPSELGLNVGLHKFLPRSRLVHDACGAEELWGNKNRWLLRLLRLQTLKNSRKGNGEGVKLFKSNTFYETCTMNKRVLS